MPSRSKLAALAVVPLAASMLTGCGSGSSAYCKELKSDKAYFESFQGSNPDIGKLDDAFDRMHSLADKAPDDIKDDWKVLDGALTTVDKALKDAGITFKDIAELQKTGQPPEGVDMQKLTALGSKLQSLGDAKFDKAAKAIEKHAKDECKVTLSKS